MKEIKTKQYKQAHPNNGDGGDDLFMNEEGYNSYDFETCLDDCNDVCNTVDCKEDCEDSCEEDFGPDADNNQDRFASTSDWINYGKYLLKNDVEFRKQAKRLGLIRTAQEEVEEDKQALMDRLMADAEGTSSSGYGAIRKALESGRINETGKRAVELILKETNLSSEDAITLVTNRDKVEGGGSNAALEPTAALHFAKKMEEYGITATQAASAARAFDAMDGPSSMMAYKILGSNPDMSTYKARELVKDIKGYVSDQDRQNNIVNIMNQHGLGIDDAKRLDSAQAQKKHERWQAHLRSKGL